MNAFPMKACFIVAALLAIGLAAADDSKTSPSGASLACNMTNRFAVSGMHCDGCAKGITSELRQAPGVVCASVSFSNKVATVVYDKNRISTKELRKVIVEAGYEAKLAKP